MKVEFHPAFRTDLAEATRYYREQGGAELAEAFIEEVFRTIRAVKRNPEQFSFAYGEVRRARLSRFNAYAVRYSFDDATETVFIGSLLHGARHPDTGQDRF